MHSVEHLNAEKPASFSLNYSIHFFSVGVDLYQALEFGTRYSIVVQHRDYFKLGDPIVIKELDTETKKETGNCSVYRIAEIWSLDSSPFTKPDLELVLGLFY